MQSLNEKIGFEPTKEAVVEEFGETATIAPTLPIKEQYETYNLAAASKSPTPDFTIYEDYLPAGVKEIPTAEQVIEGEYNAVVPFDQAAYERNNDAYRIIYDNKVKEYEVYLKNKKGYIKADDGRYYSPDKFDSETILNRELSLISEYNIAGKPVPIMDEPNEAIYTYWKDKLEKFGFDLKYNPSAIGTSITVVSSHTGERTGIDLDTLGDDADRRQVEKLKTFVKNNFDEDGVEQKDLIESLSSETRASMGGPTESRYKTVPKGRVISDAEVDIEGIDAALKVAKKNLEEAEAMPDRINEWRGNNKSSVPNKKKSQKIAQAKQQIKNLEGESVKAQDKLTSAKEGKTQKANAFASEVLSGQVATEAERLEAQGLENRYKYKVSQGVAKKLEDAYQRAKELEDEYHTPEGWTNAEAMTEYNSISKEILPDVKTYSELVKITQESIDTYQVDKENLRQDVGRKVIMDAEMGGVGSSIVRALVSGTGGVVEGFVETIFGDAYANINNLFYNEYEEGYLTDAERKEIKKDSIQDDWVSSVDRSLGITEESAEAYRKNLSYEDMIKNLAYIGPDGQTKDVMEGGNVLTEGLYGLLESMPAMATSIINPGAAVISFASMGINGINKEMESNQMFDNVSENEKLLITLPYGIVMGVLENYGFRNALKNSSLIGKIMMNSLKKSKKAGSRSFRELVVDEIENKVLKVGILTASSAAAEFETGATQQVFEAYIKEGYDVAKGQDYFKQSIDLLNGKYITKEFVGEVWRAGLAEAVGGFAMGAAPAISTAVRENKIAEIPIGRFIVLEKAMLDPTLRKVAKMRLDEDVAMGMKTREDADAEFQDFNITLGQMRAIPQEFDVKSKQQILALESQKKEIGDRIEGKSKFTTREEQRQIKVLEERIEEISAKAKENIPENQARYEEAKTNDGFEGTINEFLNNEILTEELLKVIEKSPEKEASTESITEVASEPDVEEEVTQEQLAEVRALEAVTAEETKVEERVEPTEEQRKELEKKAVRELKKDNRQTKRKGFKGDKIKGTRKKYESTQEEIDARVDELFQAQQQEDQEVLDLETAVEEEVTTEEAPVTKEEQDAKDKARAEKLAELDRNLREATTEKAPVTEAQEVVDDGKVPEVTQEQQDRYNSKEMSDEEIKGVLVGLNTKVQMRAEGKTEEKITSFERKIKDENETLFREVIGMRTAPKTETKVETPKKKAPKKEAPKKETGVDAKLRSIAVKMDKAAKEKVSSKLTKAERELIKKNTKRFKEISDEVKMPTTTADGIRSAITMIEDSFKDKESKIKEQIKRIDARVSDRMTKDKDRKKKKDELSKARKENNARVKELKGKLTEMGAKFRLSDDVVSQTEEGFITEDDIVEGMKELGPVEKAFRGARVQTEQSDIDVISGKMRFAFPGVSVSQTQQEFDEALKQEGIRTAESNGNTILGLTKDGKIFLNPSRKSLSTPIHEFGHIWIDFLRSESSKTKGTKLLKKGLELVEGTKALESAIKKYGDNELAREEALVELMGTKGETIANAAKRAKFIEWFNAFFKYIKEKLTRFKDVKVKDIKDISLEDFVDIGLAELFSGQAVDKDADVKFKPEEAATSAKARMQIIGENADLSQQVRENLSIARAMEENNQSPKDIRLATGWEKGTDGNWRYETLPNELNKESKALKEIDDSVFEIVKVAVKNPEKLIETKKEYKLSDLIKNKELFNAYRKMSQEEAMEKFGRWDATMNESIEDLKVVIDISTYHYEGGLEGVFMKPAFFQGEDPSITIYVNPLYYYDKPFREREFELLQIISHEVQHYAQMLKEDFSRGTSSEGVLDEISSSLANVYQRQKEIIGSVINSIRFSAEFDIDVRDKLSPKIEEIFYSEMSSEEMSKKINNLISKSKGDEKLLLEKVKSKLDKIISIEQRIEQYEEVGSSSQDFENYKKAAGEVEARNVEERLSMTPEQRRETLFEETEDVAREDQLLFMSEFDAESFYSMASMKEKGIDLKGAIEKVISRARAKEISDNVIIAYMMEDKGFDRKKALATIKRVNRKNLRSAIKSLFASVKDITNISEQEAELVKELLKYDRATTRADKAIQKKAKQELLAQVNVMARVSKGKISPAQLSAVISKLTRVNLSRQSSIDNFVEYMRKVFGDADYAQKITGLKPKIAQAKTNIRTKVGIGQDGLTYELSNLLNIDPSIIPDDVFTKYEKLVTSVGAKKTVLSLPEATQVKKDIADINESLNTQNSLVGELTERFNSFEDKKTTEDGKVEYAPTVKRMLKDKSITEEEAKLMTKFSNDINPREDKEGKSEEQKQKEMEEEKKELIQEVKDSEINAQAIDDKMSKQVAQDLSELINTEDVNELSNPQLKNLIKVIDNINNGHLTHNAKLMIEALESSDDSDTGTDGVQNANPLKVGKELAKLKTLTRKGKDKNTFYKLLERNPLYYLDTVLGDATSKKIFNSVMEKPAEAFSKYNTELNKAYDEIDKAERLIIKHFKSNGNNVTFSKFKQMAYMVQEEFESNPNSNQVNPASEVLDATIEKLEETNQERNAEALLKIKEDFSTNGQIDLDKLMKSFSTAEKKMLKAIKQFNSSQTDMAVFTAAIIRGQAIDPLNNYVHQQVLSEGADNVAAGSAFEDLSKMTDMFALNTKPSTKAKNLIERTKGAKAINFDVVSATKRAAKMTLMDYHLTSSLRTANKTLNKMSDKLDKKGQQRQIFKGIRDGYNQAIRDALQVNFAADYSLIGKGFQVLTKNAYRGILAHSGRVGVEFLSNLSFAINNPRDFSQGVRHLDVALGSMGAEVMNNVDSKQTTRVYPSGLSGNYVDPNLITDNKGVVSNEMKNPVVNKLNQAMALGPSRLTKGVGAIADTMLSGPDKVMMRPIWFGSFAREFTAQVKNRKDLIMETAKMRKEGATDKQIEDYIKKETEVDFKKIAENDAEYMSKYKKEIREAKRKADDNSVLMGSTNNPLMGILKNTKRNSDTFAAAAYKNFNTFMQNFLLFEFNAFRRGWYTAMQGKTKEQKASGLLLMGAVSLRMMMYNVLMSYGFSLFFGGDDDKEEDSLATRVSRSFWNTFTGMILGRDFGAAVKSLIGVGVESVNKIHGEDLGIREGEYNPYKNSVQFNPLQMLIGKEKDEDTGEESWTIMSSKPKEVLAYRPVNVLSDIAPNFLGPLSPLAKTLSFGVNKVLLEKPKTTEEGKRKDELEEYRLLLEIGGHSGFVPFYKDFRNELLDEMYKDVGKKKKSSGSKGGQKLRKLRKLPKQRKLRKLQ